MEQHLIDIKPYADTLALLVFSFPLVRWLVSDLSASFAPTLQFIIVLSTLFISFRATSIPQAWASDSKPVKRSLKARNPHLWTLVVRVYLYLTGERVLLRSSSFSKQKARDSSENDPQITLVGPTYVGVVCGSSLAADSFLFYIDGVPWTQVYTSENYGTVLCGLSPNTLYRVHAKAHVSSSEYLTLNFLICTSLLDPKQENPPRPRERVEVYKEAFELMSEELNQIKLRARKSRRDHVKKLTAMRHEIDCAEMKIATKRKADERSRKRIQALRDRVSQQKMELCELEKQGSHALRSAEEASQLSTSLEEVQKTRKSREQGLEVSVRVWMELQRAKQSEIDKLQPRCAKLEARLERAQSDRTSNQSVKAKAIADLVSQLKKERNARKQRRVRLEADFMSAIAKLNA